MGASFRPPFILLPQTQCRWLALAPRRWCGGGRSASAAAARPIPWPSRRNLCWRARSSRCGKVEVMSAVELHCLTLLLLQEGQINKSWKSRWFVLTDQELSYYKSPLDTVCKGKGRGSRVGSHRRPSAPPGRTRLAPFSSAHAAAASSRILAIDPTALRCCRGWRRSASTTFALQGEFAGFRGTKLILCILPLQRRRAHRVAAGH